MPPDDHRWLRRQQKQQVLPVTKHAPDPFPVKICSAGEPGESISAKIHSVLCHNDSAASPKYLDSIVVGCAPAMQEPPEGIGSLVPSQGSLMEPFDADSLCGGSSIMSTGRRAMASAPYSDFADPGDLDWDISVSSVNRWLSAHEKRPSTTPASTRASLLSPPGFGPGRAATVTPSVGHFPRPGTTGTSRPGTTSTSRPGTNSSQRLRPGTGPGPVGVPLTSRPAGPGRPASYTPASTHHTLQSPRQPTAVARHLSANSHHSHHDPPRLLAGPAAEASKRPCFGRADTSLLGGSECSVRTQHLHASFSKTPEDIEVRINQLYDSMQATRDREGQGSKENSKLPFESKPLVPNSVRKNLQRGHSRISPKGTSKTDSPKAAQEVVEEPEEDRESLEDDTEWSVIELLFEEFNRTAAGMMAVKSGASQTMANVQGTSGEELLFASEFLNFFRWLCDLAPVTLDANSTRTCEIVNTVLQPRSEVFLRSSNANIENIREFANKLADYMETPAHVIVLHKQASLIEGIGQCLVSSDANEQVQRACPRDVLLAEVHDHVQQYRSENAAAAATFLWSHKEQSQLSALLDRDHLGIDRLPAALKPLGVLWELADTERRNRGGGGAGAQQRRSWQQADAGASPRRPGSPRGGQKASPSSASRGGGGHSRLRKLEWGVDHDRKLRDEARACTLCWGDRVDALSFRRYLLNPALKFFGASKINDTCVLWTGVDTGAVPDENGDRMPDRTLSRTWSKKRMAPGTVPSFICFPPPGVFPLELLQGTMPTWTIMPDIRLFQPTQSLQVRMWRCRRDGSGGMDRLQEVGLERFSCDCSSKGTPFCVLFRPSLERIAEGDVFEVELSGLRGQEPRHHFFHEFRGFKAAMVDHSLVVASCQVVELLDDPSFWGEPKVMQHGPSAAEISHERFQARGSKTAAFLHHYHHRAEPKGNPLDTASSLIRSLEARMLEAMPTLGLVSHPMRSIITDSVDVTISLHSATCVAMKAQLFLVRASGEQEIQRATLVLKIGAYFVVRVKLPMAPNRYQLHFQVASQAHPGTFLEHPFRYNIMTTESCQNLLISAEHPLRTKFGYNVQLTPAQTHGITILAPMEYRLRSENLTYFLVHIDGKKWAELRTQRQEAAIAAWAEVEKDAPRSLRAEQKSVFFQERILSSCKASGGEGMTAADEAKEKDRMKAPNRVGKGNLKTPTPTPQAGHARFDSKTSVNSAAENSQPVGVMGTLFGTMAPRLEPIVQDSCAQAYIDLSLVQPATPQRPHPHQRYVTRLRQRSDFPGLFDGMLSLGEGDVGGKVEMLFSIPHGRPEVDGYAPQKISEWIIVCKGDHFPPGF